MSARGTLAVVLLAAGFFRCSSPKVWEIQPGATSGRTVNILFLGDGFDSAELQSYRAATYSLVEGLLEVEPFCRLTERLRFFRIDVLDPTGEVSVRPPCNTCSILQPVVVDASFQEPVAPLLVSGSESVHEQDLQVRRCESGGHCASVWPTDPGLAEIFELARDSGLDVAVVVILANGRVSAGNGHWDVRAGAPALAVITLPMYNVASAWRLTPTANRLFAHELGHALGLVDEYPVGPADTPAVADDRNVWMPPTPGPWTKAVPIPWAPVLPLGCTSTLMKDCCGELVSGSCPPCAGMNPSWNCSYVPTVCQDPGSVCPGANCAPPPSCKGVVPAKLCEQACTGRVAAWEGAAYEKIGRYRSTERCRMATLGNDAPFCPACRTWMWRAAFCDPLVAGECEDASRVNAACP